MATRLALLLDSSLEPDGGTLPYRLRRTVSLVLSRKGHITWPVLLDDLLSWDAPSRRVQKAWARSYYRTAAPTSGSVPNETSDPNE